MHPQNLPMSEIMGGNGENKGRYDENSEQKKGKYKGNIKFDNGQIDVKQWGKLRGRI